ncbi:MAG TPA: response regulator [Pseudomonadales bacterium]|nr:response regulator [Pseudomonadales bacterium]
MTKILIVDDNPDDRQLMASRLGNAGYETHCVEDGKFALEGIADFNPDLVVLDIFMPQQEGAETLLEVRNKYPKIPVVIVSGDGAFYLPIMKELGANGVALKSATFDELTLVVDSCLN